MYLKNLNVFNELISSDLIFWNMFIYILSIQSTLVKQNMFIIQGVYRKIYTYKHI